MLSTDEMLSADETKFRTVEEEDGSSARLYWAYYTQAYVRVQQLNSRVAIGRMSNKNTQRRALAAVTTLDYMTERQQPPCTALHIYTRISHTHNHTDNTHYHYQTTENSKSSSRSEPVGRLAVLIPLPFWRWPASGSVSCDSA